VILWQVVLSDGNRVELYAPSQGAVILVAKELFPHVAVVQAGRTGDW
jgi:hypothetical protein